MTRRGIEGIDGHEDESPRAKAWGRYLEQQDAFAAEEAARARAAEDEAAAETARAEERRLRAQAAERPSPSPAPGPARGPSGIAGAAAAAAAAFGQAMKQALSESPEQRRMDLFAAMQADALARLELAPHAEGAQIAQAEALGGGAAAQATDRSIAEDRRVDGEAKDVEAPARRNDARELERRPLADKTSRGSGAQREPPREGRGRNKGS
jgi:hypothetical protein